MLLDIVRYFYIYFKPNVTDGKVIVPLYMILLHPESMGSVRISSNNPYVDPVIDTNMLSHPLDVEMYLQGRY